MKKEKTLSNPLTDELLISKIFFIRGKKVMLDKDLAELYGVKPIRLREQVKRNSARFPESFVFQLTENEIDLLSQNAIPSRKNFGGTLPYVFTEHGVLMLANVLKSKKAIDISLRLIDIFIKMREIISASKDVLLKLEQFEKRITDQDTNIKVIFTTLRNLLSSPAAPRRRVGYRRQDESD